MFRRIIRVLSIGAVTAAGVTYGAAAADFADPTWPCIQRKVEKLSLGLMWPMTEEGTPEFPPETQKAITEMADKLALRRIPLADLTEDVTGFGKAHAGDPQILGAVFADVFQRLDTRRTRIIDGIGKFSLSQIALSEKIDATRVKMDTLMAADNPDFDQVDALEEQLDWDQQIYTDRQQSITYLCETPVLVEKRLYETAQMLQAQVAK